MEHINGNTVVNKTAEPHPFLTYLRIEVKDELQNQPLPKVKGTIPPWLKGTLVRNGPSKFSTDGKTLAHWFDGLAMLHSFHFQEGHVTYSNRYLRTEAYHDMVEEHSINFLGFATDPCRSIFRRLFTYFFPYDAKSNANINVAKYDEAYVALNEIPLPIEFDLETLDTQGLFHFKDSLPTHDVWESAHPHQGEHGTLNYIVRFSRNTSYLIYHLPNGSSKREIVAEIPVLRPAYMHSFSVTENHVILTEYPYTTSSLSLFLSGAPFINNYQWHKDGETVFTVIDRKTGKLVGRFPTAGFFAFHHVNAYDNANEIVLDLVSYPDASIIKRVADYGTGVTTPDFPQPDLKRFRLDISTGVIFTSVISSNPLELPRINNDFDGKVYHFVYGIDLNEAFSYGERRSIYKTNVTTGETLSWSEPGCYPGEAVFVKDPTQEPGEDSGVLLSVVLDEKNVGSFLLILNAKTMQEIARAEVPHPIPMGLHGQFFS